MQLRRITSSLNYIKAAGRIGHGRMFLQIQLCGMHQPPAFAWIDRGRAATEVLSCAVAHFHEDHGASVIHHQVQFTAAIAHVACAWLQPGLLQMLLGGGFHRRATLQVLSDHRRSASAGHR